MLGSREGLGWPGCNLWWQRGGGEEDREGIGVWLKQRLEKGEKAIDSFVLLCSFFSPQYLSHSPEVE